MCEHPTCLVRAYCYRNPASGTQPSPKWQSYMNCRPNGPDGCDSFWPLPTFQPKKKPAEAG